MMTVHTRKKDIAALRAEEKPTLPLRLWEQGLGEEAKPWVETFWDRAETG